MKLFILISLFLSSFIVEAQKSDFKDINFEKADSIAESYQNATLKNLPLLTYKLTQNLNTQVEKFRAIHTWVCSNIESDHSFGEITLRKRKKLKNDSISFSNWNNQMLSKVFKKLLKDKKTICSGYAYLIKEMATLVDIDCEIVDGYSRTTKRNVGDIDIPNHSWNAVKLNNKWYLVDATLASGYFNIDEDKFIKNYNNGYFLASPELYITKHYPLDKKWLLVNNSPSLNQFVNSPVTYGNTFKHEVVPVSPKKLVTEVLIEEEVVFDIMISDKHKIEDIILLITSGLSFKKVKPSYDNYQKGLLKIKHQFIKKGNYNVHLMVNKDIVVSYTVKVKKPKKVML